MSTITDLLSVDHRRCDEHFAEAETAVGRGDWARAAGELAAFRAALERHLSAEESVLFPALEAREPMAAGPTGVMREEHRHMRALLDELARAVAARDAESYLGASETLLVLMQQHNAKEEHVLYPMSDRVLGAEAVAPLERALADAQAHGDAATG